MTENKPQATLVSKLILLVLTLILGCLVLLVYRLYEPRPTAEEMATVAETTAPETEPASEPTAVAPTPLSRPAPAPKSLAPPIASPGPSVKLEQTTTPRQEITPAAAVASHPVAAATIPPAQSATGIAPDASPTRVLRFQTLPVGSEMRLEGDSTAGKWLSLGKTITGNFEIDVAWFERSYSNAFLRPVEIKPAPKCEIIVPARSLKSQVTSASIMDRHMYADLQANRFPNIQFKLTRLEVLEPSEGLSGAFDLNCPTILEAVGRLAMAGVTNQMVFPLRMERIGADALKFTGTYTTKMTTFGIRPPQVSLLGGGVTTADEIKLTWTWLVGLSADAVAR
jgi:hypothetical protein